MESYGTVTLTRRSNKNSQTAQVTIPAVLSRALIENGYNRAEIFLTEDGILFKPFHSDKPPQRRKFTAVLPDWS